ncbi:MAG TPA: 50S ribosomal protein L17 [Bacteroidia bacterium]|nr:50S ribosomal protein L17 [Bacteroidia bacterium]HNP97734.1 50S ribosomal protein L17 [Bacteroidia bacterium]
MRHGKKINHLGRTYSHRQALLSNLASSLILHKRINTTLAKAKALRKYVEPIITRSKDDSTHSRRMVFSYLQNKEAVAELFREVGPKVSERPGGYTRIIKMGNRPGDNAEVCMMELVDFNALMGGSAAGKEAPAKKAAKTTRRGGAKKKAAEGTEAAAEPKAKAEKKTSAKADKDDAAPKKPSTRKKKSDDKE